MGAAGSDVAINSASIALMSDDLGRLPFLIMLSRKTRSLINQNLGFGMLFITMGIAAATAGWLETMFAAFLHFAGSLIVVFNSARLVRFGEELDHGKTHH
jgi:Cd2+/Zn2+-exporting ATPase